MHVVAGIIWFAASIVVIGGVVHDATGGNLWAVAVVLFLWLVGFACAAAAATE